MGNQWAARRSEDGSVMGSGRDIAQVLLSPRFSGTVSPRHRRSNSLKQSDDLDSFEEFDYFRTGTNYSDNADVPAGLIVGTRCKKIGFIETVLCSILGNFVIRNFIGVLFKIGSRKSLRQSLLYISSLLLITLLLVKIASIGWLSVRPQEIIPQYVSLKTVGDSGLNRVLTEERQLVPNMDGSTNMLELDGSTSASNDYHLKDELWLKPDSKRLVQCIKRSRHSKRPGGRHNGYILFNANGGLNQRGVFLCKSFPRLHL